MRTAILYALVLLVVSTCAYQIGWYRGLGYEAVASAIANGQADLMVAKALKMKNTPEALKWIGLNLNAALVTLHGFEGHIPHEFTEGFAKVTSAIQEYQNENKTVQKLGQ
jgi:hypothetical protein